MGIAIRPYTEEWIPAVKAFNRRLAEGGVGPEFRFPGRSVPYWLPKLDGRHIYQEYYLAVDGGQVRGAYILKFQDFSLHGDIRPIAYYHLPLSEGIVNKAYSTIGVHMLRSAMKAQPLLYCLGMGGFDRPLPQMLKAMRWSLRAVPFYFHVNHSARFLRNMAPLRNTPIHRLACDLAAGSGSGSIAINILQRIHAARPDRSVTSELVSSFDSWADELWQQARSKYTLVAARDSETLNILYTPGKSFLCLKVRHGGETVGWAVMLDTQTENNKYFGNLRLGSIADAFAAPEHALAVLQAANRFLRDRGVDLVVSNQCHAAWAAGLKSAGFLEGPSNFILAVSKPLAELLAPFEQAQHQLHFTRGDGDGPVNL